MTQPSARFTLITAARLLDGTGAAAVEQAALLIDGDRVADLGRASDVHVADGASVERRDYGAATILPGLVDAHTHLVAPGDGTLGDDVAKEDDDILLLQAAKNARTLLHSGVNQPFCGDLKSGRWMRSTENFTASAVPPPKRETIANVARLHAFMDRHRLAAAIE